MRYKDLTPDDRQLIIRMYDPKYRENKRSFIKDLIKEAYEWSGRGV